MRCDSYYIFTFSIVMMIAFLEIDFGREFMGFGVNIE
jgi:hypothetical protein